MTAYAALTDGTTTITFASPGTLGWYRIETGWAPKVAGLRQNQLGGRGPYDDVTEEIPVSIGGSTPAHMLANISALQLLLQQSNAWYRGDNVAAVTFKYSPEGATISSAASPLHSVTWGADFSLSGTFGAIPQSASSVWTSGATMQFTRRGLWHHVSASGSASGQNGASSPVIVAVASSPYPGPLDLSVTSIVSGISSLWNMPTGFIVLSEDSTTVQFFNMEAAGSNPNYTPQSGAAASATGDPVCGSPLGGSLLSYTRADVNYTYSPGQLITLSGKRYLAMVNAKARYSSDSVRLRAYISPVSSQPIVGVTYGADFSAYITFSGSTTAAARSSWNILGHVQSPIAASSYFGIHVSGTTASPIYFDSAILIDTTKPYAVIPFYNSNYGYGSNTASPQTVTLSTNSATYISPSAAYGASNMTVDCDGYLTSKSGSLYIYVLATGTMSSSGSVVNLNNYGWQQGYVDGSNNYTSKFTNTITATRYTAYVSPV